MCESIGTTEALIVQHLQRNGLYEETASWSLKHSALGGRGIFATRDISPGEIIFVDAPLLLGPRAGKQIKEICVNCFTNVDLKSCSNGCGLPVCCRSCENSPKHQNECRMILNWRKSSTSEIDSTLYKVLSPIRSLLLEGASKELAECLLAHSDSRHGFEVDLIKEQLKLDIGEAEEKFMRSMCAVMDANAFEVIVGNEEHQSSLRGVYPLGSMANHNCLPNTMHYFDSHQRMFTKATVFIPKDQEIFHSYCRIIWSTPTRRYHLIKTKNFWCNCKRCKDPTEFGSFIGSFLCEHCSGTIVAENPLKMNSNWICLSCSRTITGKRIGFLISILGSRLGSVQGVDEMLSFLEGPVGKIVAPTNQITVELKYKLVWSLGYAKHYKLEGTYLKISVP